MDVRSGNQSGSDFSFLPISEAFFRKMEVVEEVDGLCGNQNDVFPGTWLWHFILDILSGHSPLLYRLEKSFAEMAWNRP